MLDATGAAVPGAHVVGTCIGGVCRPFPGREAVTDAEGQFRLPSGVYNTIPIGQIARLLIRLRDGSEHEAAALPAADGSVTIKLRCAATEDSPAFTARAMWRRRTWPESWLTRRASRSRALRSTRGPGIPATRPAPTHAAGSGCWISARTRKIEIEFRKPGYTPRLFLAQPTGTKDWVIVMGDKTYFEGKVTGPDGKPVVDALIRANRGPKRPQPGYMITDIWTETKSRNGRPLPAVRRSRCL